jgi:hypothetical protein
MHFAIDRAQQLRKNYKNHRKQRGHEGFEVGHIFHDFNAIQATLAVAMRAIINGRIDSKTAGRLLWELQIASKLLRLQQRAATVATRRYSSRGLEEPSLQNLGVPIRAAEQILQPHAADLEDRICHASSASGWRLEEEAVTTEQGAIELSLSEQRKPRNHYKLSKHRESVARSLNDLQSMF